MQKRIKDYLSSIAQEFQEIMACDWAAVFEYDVLQHIFDLEPILSNESLPAKVREVLEPKRLIIRDVASVCGSTIPEWLSELSTANLIALPLKIEDQLFGVLLLYYHNSQSKPQQVPQIVRASARLAGRIIQREQQYSQRRHEFVSDRLVTASRFGTEQTVKAITKMAYDLIKIKFSQGGHYSYVVMPLPGRKHLLKSANFGNIEDNAQFEVLQETILHRETKRGISGRCYETGETQNVGKVSEDQDYVAFRQDIQSQLSVPIKAASDRVLGVISIESPGEGKFDPEDVEMIEILAKQAAAVLLNSRYIHMMQLLHDTGNSLSQTEDDEIHILKTIIEQTVKVIGYIDPRMVSGHVGILEDNKLRFKAMYPEDEVRSNFQQAFENKYLTKHGDFYEIDLTEGQHKKRGIVGKAISEGRHQYFKDVDDPEARKVYIKISSQTRSQYALIMKFDNTIFGVISIEHQEADAFDEDAQRALDILARQATMAIYNYRVLEAQNKLRRNLAHTLRRPLNDLKRQLPEILPDALVGNRNRQAERLLWDIDAMGLWLDILDYEDNISIKFEPVASQELIELIKKAIYSLTPRAEHKHIEGPHVEQESFARFPSLKLRKRFFQAMIFSLCDNAVKYANNGTPITIRGNYLSNEKEITIEVIKQCL